MTEHPVKESAVESDPVTKHPKQDVVGGAYKALAPPDFLKAKVTAGQGLDLSSVESRASEAMAALERDFLQHTRETLAKLDQLIAQLASGPAGDHTTRLSEIKSLAHDLRGQAGTFGYDLVTVLGSSLFDYIEDAKGGNADLLQVIEIHVDAVKAVIAGKILGLGGERGQSLIAGLEAMIAKVTPARETAG